MLKKGVGIVAVKLGSKGCYMTDGKQSRYVEAFKVNAVDTTGAGGAFCAGFLYGLVTGKKIEKCGRIGISGFKMHKKHSHQTRTADT